MFDARVYANRRNALRQLLNGSWILILGHDEAPRNYADNPYPYRQNSHFLYFAGHAIPNMALLMTPEEDILFGYKPTVADIVWTGPLPSLESLGETVGIHRVEDINSLEQFLVTFRGGAQTLHYLPPYRGDHLLKLAGLLHLSAQETRQNASEALKRAVVELRLVKGDEEVAEIERAVEVSFHMYAAAARTIAPGRTEFEVMAAMHDAAMSRGMPLSFPPIVTIHGEVLHNHAYHNQIPAHGMVLMDTGAETTAGYASDITRTFPITGTFDSRQREIYEIVLAANERAIRMCRPDVAFRDVHLEAARVIADGLVAVGLMRGDVPQAVAAGAHALFFPHGLGHMLGLDVHDMEDLGDLVGYGPDNRRSEQFGLGYLRMIRPLRPGYCITIEPGIYFIPALVEQWRAEKRHAEFINYDQVDKYLGLGGFRIEDDVLITADSARVLGRRIPKAVADVEALMAGNYPV
ncbi:MAG: aminopeptidase P family protein [Acidobacteria bacterium]|nr:aminopeptidase P family protein [Acidobacteriota bacterium]